MGDEASPAPNSGRCVYGFALLVLSVSGFLLYFVWAVVPTAWLVALGLDYFSSKYFALAVPVTCCVSLFLFAAVVYPAVNLTLTQAPDHTSVLVDDYSRTEPPAGGDYGTGIPPVWDMDVEDVSFRLYRRTNKSAAN